MNNYEDRTMNHKRVRMDGEGTGVAQGNGLPLNYMDHLRHFPADNGHQVYGGAYGAGPYYGGGTDWGEGYGARPPYAPPAHQPYQQPAFLPQQHLHMGYEQRHHLLAPPPHKWSAPLHEAPAALKLEPEEPKIKIKTDLFKDEAPPAPAPVPVVAPAPEKKEEPPVQPVAPIPPPAPAPVQVVTPAPALTPAPVPEERVAPATPTAAPAPPAAAPSPVAPTTPVAAPVVETPVQETPKIKTEEEKPTPPSVPSEGKKRGRPKGSTNKPKPPELMGGTPRGPVGRPRGGAHSTSYMRPYKRDFSGIRFRRRWSDDDLESVHIPNEVYFGDVHVPMEVLYNYYDANAEREKVQAQQQAAAKAAGTNVTLVYSSSDSSSDDSSDSDSSDSDPNQQEQGGGEQKRRPGRPRGSKTVNRRSDGPRTPSVHSGDKPAGITDMKRFLKAAGIQYDYNQLVEGCMSNKERVAKLLALLRERGLEGEPTLEACRALYSGPAPRRRGPKPGTKRGPRKPRPAASPLPESAPEATSDTETKTPEQKDGRRVTRGQTSGKPRQRIVISSDEEDAHTPLSKLRGTR